METVLIKKQKKKGTPEGRDSDLQEATANALADLRLKENSANTPLYIVTVEDPSVRTKRRSFAALKLRDQSPICLDMTGVEIDTKKQEFETFSDVENYVKTEGSVVVNIRFPWTRVINIENKTYKPK